MVSFGVGDEVKVRRAVVSGHCRTPHYVMGRRGTVVAVHGRFPNPETRAYGGNGHPAPMLYLVGFSSTEVWPDYDGPSQDRVLVDLFEHWLVPGDWMNADG